MENYSGDYSCEKLWKAVVIQMLNDACVEPQDSIPDAIPEGVTAYKWARASKAREASRRDGIRNRSRARAWLRGTSRDFRMVCEMAGWEPGYVRQVAEKLKAKGWVMPTAAEIEMMS